MRALLLAAALVLPSWGQPAAPAAVLAARELSLGEAFSLATLRSEELALRAEGVAEIDARVDELWSLVRPKVTLKGSEFIQDSSDGGQTGVAGTFNRRSRPEAKVTAHQPVFAGMREFLTLKAARKEGEAAELELKRARSLLYVDVARAFADLLRLQQEITIREALAAITADRVKELEDRVRLGRSRRSEVIAAETQLAQIEARLEGARGSERVAQESLRFLTGLSEDLKPSGLSVPPGEPLDGFLSRAALRPDVEARRLQVEAAGLIARSAARERWPVVGLDGNYFLKRTGFQEDIRWDATLTAELPLYWGGGIGAREAQSETRRRAAEHSLTLASRRAEVEVRSAWRDLDAALRRVKALERAAALAEENAGAQAEDYRLGLVTNLEVLGTLNALQEARLDLDDARIDASLARVRLEAAAGGP